MRDVKRKRPALVSFIPILPLAGAWRRDGLNVLFSILAAPVAAVLYFGWAALGTLRSGEVSLYVRANRDIRFSRRANPAGYWIAVLLVPRARRGLCLGHRHSRVVAM